MDIVGKDVRKEDLAEGWPHPAAHAVPALGWGLPGQDLTPSALLRVLLVLLVPSALLVPAALL